MDQENDKISSELYSEYDYISKSKPTLFKNNVVSKFCFKYPPVVAVIDSDGDLIVQRKRSSESDTGVIELEHSKSTVLELVGLQIWRGALLLADWLLYSGNNISKNSFILELGSGVGLTSLIAAMFAPVVCTDVNKGGLLELIKGNVERNKGTTRFPIEVLELDFTTESFNTQIMEILPKVQIILAADVIYDDCITTAFLNTVKRLLERSSRSVYLALEKRYVFTIADCDTVAPCFEYFLDCLKKLMHIKAEEIPLNFPQYFQYDRCKELVLWKISSIS